jgi:hypothetical protein
MREDSNLRAARGGSCLAGRRIHHSATHPRDGQTDTDTAQGFNPRAGQNLIFLIKLPTTHLQEIIKFRITVTTYLAK